MWPVILPVENKKQVKFVTPVNLPKPLRALGSLKSYELRPEDAPFLRLGFTKRQKKTHF